MEAISYAAVTSSFEVPLWIHFANEYFDQYQIWSPAYHCNHDFQYKEFASNFKVPQRDSTMADQKSTPQLTATCYINRDGKHSAICNINRSCHRRTENYPPLLSYDQWLSQSRDPQESPGPAVHHGADSLARQPGTNGSSSSFTDEEYPPGYPRPSNYWTKPHRAPDFLGSYSKYWKDEPPLPPCWGPCRCCPPSKRTLSPASTIPKHLRAPRPPTGLPARFPPALPDDQNSRPRNHLGQFIEESPQIVQRAEVEIVTPKPVRPSENPEAESEMSDFLEKYTPETNSLDQGLVWAALLHPDYLFQ